MTQKQLGECTVKSRIKSLAFAGLVLGVLNPSAQAGDTLRVLIIDGQNNHNWARMSPPMKRVLEKTGQFTVDVATTPPANSGKSSWDKFRPDFTKYHVVLSNYNGESWPDEVNRALEKFVSGGGGLVIIHAANNAFPGWAEYNQMIGLGWRGRDFGDRITVDDNGRIVRTPKGEGPDSSHGPVHQFKIVVRDADHPVTKGMPREWMHAKDELYHGQRGPAENMHILATAYSASDKAGTAAHEPMIWWVPFGNGRVFTTVMGHVMGDDTTAIRCVGFQTVLTRGCEWAATGKVTLPVPNSFPSATETTVAND
jgi:type 1 glutamine amidotransferase